MPWRRGGIQSVLPTNAVTGQAYRGVNMLSVERGYASGDGATLRQRRARACARSTRRRSCFTGEIAVAAEPDGEDGQAETARRCFARGYWVFAAEQVVGYQPAAGLPPNPIAHIAAAEAYFAATGAKVAVGGT